MASYRNIGVEVIETESLPLVTAKLFERDDLMVVAGEVHKRRSTPLNGYITLTIIDSQGTQLWMDTAELTIAGPSRFHYRVFEKLGISIPPPGSKIVVEFHKSS